ncbi:MULTISPECIES: hypothetical protein [Haloarcula]|uniref:hypothetical protein n=1 Tax=Haloarcula TaxID=2237 RepID=UPI0023EDDEF6|nr:hypothetical protein [Halomicroarcula sp. XH51]
MGDRMHQLVDLLVSTIIAGTTIFVWQFATGSPFIAVWLGTLFAAMYYFSRNPWGSTRGEQYNEWIDDFYEEYLP